MASKKPAKPAKTPKTTSKIPVEYLDDDGYYVLKGELLWQYRALDAELRNLSLDAKSRAEELQAELDKHPEIKELISAKNAITAETAVKMHDLQLLHKQIEDIFSVSLKNCAIDDKTGRIHEFVDGQPVPIQAQPRNNKKKTTATKKK